MTDTAIQVESLSKAYYKGMAENADRTFRELISDMAAAPLRRIKSLRHGAHGRSEIFYALKDINLEIPAGQVVGLIGRNGAGKSTLLKVLSRITRPTSGHARLHGRVGSLLEVGTGFHPDLTGRENIYMNGAIIGMRKSEIDSKFDQIVDFSGVSEFLDTPVKRYSSGMRVRLGFAVAAHLDTEILFVDEVLAVGDMEFQRRCLGKMGQVAQQGRTIIFVSHNMASMATLCKRGILLDGGQITFDGAMDEAIGLYLAHDKTDADAGPVRNFEPVKYKAAQITSVKILNSDGLPSLRHDIFQPVKIQFGCQINKPCQDMCASCQIRTPIGSLVLNSFNSDSDFATNRAKPQAANWQAGKYTFELDLPAQTFNATSYELAINLFNPEVEVFDTVDKIFLEFTDSTGYSAGPFNRRRRGVVAMPLKWISRRLDDAV